MFRRFRPLLTLGHQQELRELVRRRGAVSVGTEVLAESVAAVDDRLASLRSLGLSLGDLIPTIRYAATLRTLRDLLIQGWKLREDDEGILLDAPGRASTSA